MQLTDLSITNEEHGPCNGEDLFKPTNDTFFGVKTTAFGHVDSPENSSCGSFSEQTNSELRYDRYFSLSPSPVSNEQNSDVLKSALIEHTGQNDDPNPGEGSSNDNNSVVSQGATSSDHHSSQNPVTASTSPDNVL